MSGPAARLLGRLKLRQLALVLAVEETRTMHRAAERMAVSQPNASRLLQEIERTLDAKLFDRLPQGMVPTQAGRLVAWHARLLLSDLTRMGTALDGLRDGVTGHVRIGAIVAALPVLLGDAVASLTKAHPTLSLSVTTETSDTLLASLQAGRLDIMIGRPVEHGDGHGLDVETLAEEELCIVCGPQHALAGRTGLTLVDVGAERWILQPSPSPMRRAMEAVFSRAQLPLPPHPVEAASVTATIALLGHTPLLAVMPRSLADFFAAHGLVCRLGPELPPLLAPYALITPRGRPVDPAVGIVLDALRRARRDQDS